MQNLVIKDKVNKRLEIQLDVRQLYGRYKATGLIPRSGVGVGSKLKGKFSPTHVPTLVKNPNFALKRQVVVVIAIADDAGMSWGLALNCPK